MFDLLVLFFGLYYTRGCAY